MRCLTWSRRSGHNPHTLCPAGAADCFFENQRHLPVATYHACRFPGRRPCRGYFILFGDSYVYVSFRGRYRPVLGAIAVLEVPQPVQSRPSPFGRCRQRLGPDATGVGWIYQ